MSGLDLIEIFSLDLFEHLNSAVIVKTNCKAVENLFQVLVLVYQLTILKKGYKTALAYHGWVSKLIGRSHFYHHSNHIANFVPRSLLQQLTTFLDVSIFFVCDALFETDGIDQFIVRNCNAKSNGRGVSDLFERFICIFQYFKLKIICTLNDRSSEYCSTVPETSFNDIWTGYFDIFWPFKQSIQYSLWSLRLLNIHFLFILLSFGIEDEAVNRLGIGDDDARYLIIDTLGVGQLLFKSCFNFLCLSFITVLLSVQLKLKG